MTAISLLGEPCARHSAELHRAGRVYHSNGCPLDPPACASCGARWVEDGGTRLLLHSEDCAYLKALS